MRFLEGGVCEADSEIARAETVSVNVGVKVSGWRLVVGPARATGNDLVRSGDARPWSRAPPLG